MITVGLAAVLVCAMLVCASAATKPLCVDPEMREQVRTLMLAGIDDALKRHVGRIFNSWMKDPSQQPTRAKAGIQHGIAAYIGSRQAAEHWDPPRCGEE